MSSKIGFFVYLIFIALIPVTAKNQDFSDKENKLNYRLGVISESNHNWLNATPLNVDNKLVPQIRYGNFSSADIFLNWKYLSVAVKGVASYMDRDAPDYKAIIRELYVDHALGNFLHLTLGRKILKWGTGYAFNPTGVIEPARNAADPSDRREQYQGRQIISLDGYSGNNSVTLVYANETTYNTKFNQGKSEFACRGYSLIKGADFSLITHWKEDDKFKFGFTTAYTYGAHLELHSEFIAQQGTNKLYHRVLDSLDYQISPANYPYVARYNNSRKIFTRLLLGVQYIFDSGSSLMAEYFYNQEGLTASEWNRWRQFILYHQERITTAIPLDPLSFQHFYSALYTLDRKGSMRHYGFCRLYLPQQKSGLELMLFSNLVDGSSAGIATFNYFLNSHLTGWLRVEFYAGDRASEFGLLFLRSAILLGAKFSL